ncbi:tyrosine-type recombinase/integrase [Rossellomorea sp. AcN35-11]|nr:tyrosine-type recombinase/integrase [Rossellomorea aquimaris]WJV29719.1 tyrosine-type recombinase/integrase [Rossellomorea sp. AcN35-11]
MRLSEAWEKDQLDKKVEGYSPLTLKAYCFQYTLLLKHFGDISINNFTTEALKSYLINSGDDLKPASMGHRVRCIRSLFKWIHDEGHLLNNPAAKLKEPKIGKRIPKFLTELEIEHLRESCESTLENALIEFFYSTGYRIGEIIKLNREDINFSANSVIVHGKGDKEREVYFNTRCSLWLKRYLDERDDQENCLFVTERKPKHRMSIDMIRYIVKRVSKRAGIKKSIHPHQLRHSYATHLINNGAPLEVIQSLLGHEKSETTKIYAQLSGKLRQDFYCNYF